MATSEILRRASAPEDLVPDGKHSPRSSEQRVSSRIWMGIDVLTILVAVTLVAVYGANTGWMHVQSVGTLLVLLCGFTVVLIANSRRLKLYAPMRFTSLLREQRLSVQSCLSSGLLLTGVLFLARPAVISRSIVVLTVSAVMIALSLRRLAYRLLLYRRYKRGVGLRNALIVGTGDEAQALGQLLRRKKNLGYALQGFIALPGAHSGGRVEGERVLGGVDSLFLHVRRMFIDEIFLTTPCERGVLLDLLEDARDLRVDLRLVPEVMDGLVWKSPVEYVGELPTIPLHRGRISEAGLLLKRGMDLFFSFSMLLLLSPLLLLIALLIRMDSRGPVFYCSERLGKKGRIFQCIKFRTMVQNAEEQLDGIRHLNEREGVLFKVSNDPRITRLGHWLRKYSLDELPQFINVLRGEMSVVGPRPPLASEVRKYKVDHLRRLDVMPGITGLWQVQGRQDPSFDSYVSLDVTYIENWSLWLDMAIILRTVGVVVAGTGS